MPRRSEASRPASFSFFKWWETVGWDTPTSEMSHTHASPLGAEATAENRRSRTGSLSALNIAAVRSASAAVSVRSVSGGQHGTTSGSSTGSVRLFDIHLC